MKQKKLLKNTAVTSLMTLMVVAGVGVWGLLQVEREIKTNLQSQMTASLESTVKVITQWVYERKVSIESTAESPGVRKNIIHLMEKTAGKELTREQLLNLPEQKWLRKNLGAITKKYDFTGFVIIDTSSRQVAALLDDPVGRRDLASRSDFIARALKGETVISVPFNSEVPLPDIHGHLRESWPTMFAATPIRDDKGRVIAVLSFRLRPEVTFTDMLMTRPGASGETYAFDRQGRMISSSRFEEQLKSIGLIPDNSESFSILNIEIRDPGGDMTQGFVPQIPREDQPLTLMAQSAVSGNKGWDVDGYNDYRGVQVVGAWTWLDEFQFGLTHEIDVEEAFTPLHTLKSIFFIIFGLLLIAALLGLIQFYRRERAEEAQLLEQRQTQQMARRLESIFNNTIDAIIIIDDQGTIESFNPAAEYIFGYSSKEIINKNINILMPEPYHSEHDGYLEKYRQTGKTHVIGSVRELTGLRKDGTTFTMELAVSELHLETGGKYIGVVRDITERKKIENEIDQARHEAETANNAKSKFLSQMSHELRTPLNAILGFAQILSRDLKSMEPSVQEECLDYILNGGNHLLELINDVLDLSRVETGNLSVSLEPTKLAPLIREALTLSEPLTKDNQIDLIDNIFSDTNLTVLADRVRLRQVLLNLVSNAIKYNRPQGTVTLSCETEGENRVRISVTDTGLGIPAKDHSRLFQPFTRLEEHETLIQGSGIGLTICKELMSLMGGEIHLESEVGKGSTFSIDLALCKDPVSQVQLKEIPASLPSTEVARDTDSFVLYVEDNPANMQLVERIIQTHRPEVKLLVASNGQEGLTLARKYNPFLILLDLHMPQINGWDVFERLQQSPATRNIPVVAVSANAMEDNIKKTLEMGFEQYLTKPIILDDFLNVLNHYFSTRSSSLNSRK
jgi:PAS domain S-box-containing protein